MISCEEYCDLSAPCSPVDVLGDSGAISDTNATSLWDASQGNDELLGFLDMVSNEDQLGTAIELGFTSKNKSRYDSYLNNWISEG